VFRRRAIVSGFLALTALAAASVSAARWTPPAPAAPAGPDAPSVLLIVTDDQRFDQIDGMPVVQRELVDRGVTFENSFVSNALCCPSRTAIFTGDLSHTTTVYREAPPFGGFTAFDDRSTIVTALRARGYATGMFGKYIDAFQGPAARGYIPPGWSRFVAFSHSQYTDFTLSVDGVLVHAAPGDYSTDVLGRAAEEFIRATDGPVFLEFAPAAPHDPATPAPRDAEAFADLAPFDSPAFDEADVSDKPAYMRVLPRLSPDDRLAIQELRRGQYRTLAGVDRWVGRLLDALADTGRLSNTLIVFTSDNGLAWGEHRWGKKEVPYESSIRVPLVVRFDPLTAPKAGAASRAMAVNVDIAPTIADLTGTPIGPVDGRALTPLLRSPAGVAGWRDVFVLEHMEGTNPIPTYCGIRTDDEKYVRYATGEEELYDLRTDPYELENLVSTSPDRARLSALADRLCRPKPPGWFDGTGSVPAAGVSTFAGLVAAAAVRRRRRTTQGTR
jgi:arylsulfatase A-like enzyme